MVKREPTRQRQRGNGVRCYLTVKERGCVEDQAQQPGSESRIPRRFSAGPQVDLGSRIVASVFRMECPQCKGQNSETAEFCGQCGTKLGLRCSKCGFLNAAAAKFCQECGHRLSHPGASSVAAQGGSGTATREERRWATILFADLSGFTALSGAMDPEDVKEMAHRCAEKMSAEVRRFGGTVINVVGDQIVCVFGAPLAHEDDAERAVRAGWPFGIALSRRKRRNRLKSMSGSIRVK